MMKDIGQTVDEAVVSILEDLPFLLTEEEKGEYLVRVLAHIAGQAIESWDMLWRESLGL